MNFPRIIEIIFFLLWRCSEWIVARTKWNVFRTHQTLRPGVHFYSDRIAETNQRNHLRESKQQTYQLGAQVNRTTRNLSSIYLSINPFIAIHLGSTSIRFTIITWKKCPASHQKRIPPKQSILQRINDSTRKTI